MVSALVDIFSTIPQLLASGYFCGKFIKTKRFRLFMLLWTSLHMAVYVFTGYGPIQSYTLRAILQTILQLVLLLTFSQIPRPHSTAYVLLCCGCMFLFELFWDGAFYLIDSSFLQTMQNNAKVMASYKLTFFPVCVLSWAVPYWLLRRLFKTDGNSEITRYLPFLLLQVVLMMPPMVMTIGTPDYATRNFVLCAIYLLADVGLDLLLLRTFGKLSAVHALELQQKQTENMLQAQTDYYHQLQDNATSIRKIRHDMVNQLQTLSILMEDNALDAAQQQLASLREHISRTGKNRHTGNPVVDAVIESKTGLCAEAGIRFHCSGSLPESLSIEAVSLCSIAANLLDNAIHACQKLKPEVDAYVHFSAGVKEGRLVFSCENPAPDAVKLPANEPELNQEHGWGLSILRNIAQTYHGALQIQQQDQTVTSVLWLQGTEGDSNP